jgi:uncharacterized membrane protein
MFAVVVLTNAVVFLPIVRDSPVRVLLGLPFVLFVPGYVFIAALFPEAGQPPTQEVLAEAEADDDDDSGYSLKGLLGGPLGSDRGIDGIERVALAFRLSIAITTGSSPVYTPCYQRGGRKSRSSRITALDSERRTCELAYTSD